MKVREPQWLQAGGLVPKFEEPASKISNIKQTRPDFWSTYNPDVIAQWKVLAANPNITLEEMNDFIRSHWDLYQNTGYTGESAIKHSDVNPYQKKYHLPVGSGGYGFGNTDSFWSGFERLGTGKGTTDRRTINPFTGDNYYGGQTHRRRATFFSKEELDQANAAVAPRGWKFVEAPELNYNDDPNRKAYILTTVSEQNQPEEATEESGDNNSAAQKQPKQGGTATTTTYRSPQQGPFRIDYGAHIKPKQSKLHWSDWLPLTGQLINDLVTNSYINQQKKKTRFTLREDPYLQHAVTDDYYARTQLKKAADTARQFASTQNLTSDINQNLRIRDAAEKQAGQYETQAGQMKSNKFAEETKLAEAVRNANINAGVETANYNRQQNAAAWNNILIANQEQAAKNLQAANTYIGNMYTSFGEALKTKRLNDYRYQKAYNQAIANDKIKSARQRFSAASNDITQWNDFGVMFDSALNSGDFEQYFNGKGLQKNWKDQVAAGGLTQDQKDAFINWITTGTSNEATQWRARWDAYRKQLQNEYYDQVISANRWLEQQNLDIPLYVDNQLHFTEDPYQRESRISPVFTSRYQKGGMLKSRLSEFTKQYQRELQHVRRSQDRRNETSLKHLDKQLDRLNREQIILLRSAFK